MSAEPLCYKTTRSRCPGKLLTAGCSEPGGQAAERSSPEHGGEPAVCEDFEPASTDRAGHCPLAKESNGAAQPRSPRATVGVDMEQRGKRRKPMLTTQCLSLLISKPLPTIPLPDSDNKGLVSTYCVPCTLLGINTDVTGPWAL